MIKKIWVVLFCCIWFSLYSLGLPTNEKLIFDIKYGKISAGTATFNTLVTTFESQEVYRIFTTAQTNSFFDKVFKVRDNIESISTIDSLYSLRFTKNLNEGTYRQHRIHRNYLEENYSVYLRFNHKENKFGDPVIIEIPSNTYDLLTAISKVRTINLEPGDVIPLNVTVDGKNYNALANILRKEKIKTILGEKECFVVEPSLEGDAIFRQTGVIHVWITDDDQRIPVLLQSKVIFGHFRAILTEVASHP